MPLPTEKKGRVWLPQPGDGGNFKQFPSVKLYYYQLFKQQPLNHTKPNKNKRVTIYNEIHLNTCQTRLVNDKNNSTQI